MDGSALGPFRPSKPLRVREFPWLLVSRSCVQGDPITASFVSRPIPDPTERTAERIYTPSRTRRALSLQSYVLQTNPPREGLLFLFRHSPPPQKLYVTLAPFIRPQSGHRSIVGDRVGHRSVAPNEARVGTIEGCPVIIVTPEGPKPSCDCLLLRRMLTEQLTCRAHDISQRVERQ